MVPNYVKISRWQVAAMVLGALYCLFIRGEGTAYTLFFYAVVTLYLFYALKLALGLLADHLGWLEDV